MPQTTGLLRDGKPIIQVALSDAVPSPSAVTPLSVGSATFPLRTYRALLDTGADITCICDSVVRECRLRQYGLTMVTGGAGDNRHATHIVQLGIWCEDPHDFEGEPQVTRTLYQLPEPVEAISIRDNRWFDIIIGTDIIAQHELRLTKGGGFAFLLG